MAVLEGMTTVSFRATPLYGRMIFEAVVVFLPFAIAAAAIKGRPASSRLSQAMPEADR